jgi:hypothetical protein
MSFKRATAEIDWLPEVDQARVSLVIDSEGNPAVAWPDHRTGEKHVYFARSFDGGKTFTPGVEVDPSTGRQDRPCLVLDSNENPVIAWIEVHDVAENMNPVGYIHVSRSTDGGATFLPSVSVYPESKPHQGWPALAIDSNDNPMVGMHYYSAANLWDVFFTRSIDQGASFLTPIPVASDANNQYIMGNDAIALDSNDRPYIALMDDRSGQWNIRITKSAPDGKSFLESVPIDSSPGRQIVPSLAIDSNDTLYVTWADSRSGVSNIRFTMSKDGGVTFRESIPVDPVDVLQNRTCLAVDSVRGVVHVVWTDNRQGTYYVYHSMSLNSGYSFLPGMPVYAYPVE